MSSSWFGKQWRGAGTVWSLGTFALFLFSLWFIGSLVVHHFEDAGMNGVYEASDGFGDMTFWPNGTYLFSSMGIQLPGKYQVRNNGTVDMLAQYNSALHPAPNASPDDQAASGFMGIFAAGLGDGTVSSDRNTFQWQGHTFSYDHRPTTVAPAVPDPNAPQTGGPPSGTLPLSQNAPGVGQ